MPRLRTAAAATLLVIPIVAGGFLLQEAPAHSNAVLFDQVMSLVRNQYVDSIPLAVGYEKAARGLVHELNDPYSELLSPKQSEDFNRSTGGRYGGTGMSVTDQGNGAYVVERVFPNTPAEEAGVREGDHIVSVDNTSTATLTLGKVSELLRGEPGSQVSVTYVRPAVSEPIKIRFTRRIIRIPAVPYATVLADHIGYVPLQTFNENAADEVAESVEKLQSEGAKGIVLDMRDNGGGIVDQALKTSSLFLRDGMEISSVRSRNQPTEILRSSGRHVALTVPLVVLVDGGSASATEIVAGALQDHDRALVVGSNSFGKGLVQSVYQLQGGYQLKITTGKWYTPSGRSIHRERKLVNGAFVEVHPDSVSTASRPTYKSDGGRVVYGGGGIRPDIMVPDDTVPTAEREFLRAVAPRVQEINTVLQNYAFELKGTVGRDFTVPAAWTTELMRRLQAAGVKVEPARDSAARRFLTHDLANRVARMSFGEAVAKVRLLPEDHQLLKAIDLLEKSSTQAQLLAAATPTSGSARK
jgi:carboxyl-terminal processing protease